MPDDVRIDNIPLAQGYAKPATDEDLVKDAAGVTYPNLHRRINTDLARLREEYSLTTPTGVELTNESGATLTVSAEHGPGNAQRFAILVQGANSYRTTTPLIHKEDSEDSEIP